MSTTANAMGWRKRFHIGEPSEPLVNIEHRTDKNGLHLRVSFGSVEAVAVNAHGIQNNLNSYPLYGGWENASRMFVGENLTLTGFEIQEFPRARLPNGTPEFLPRLRLDVMREARTLFQAAGPEHENPRKRFISVLAHEFTGAWAVCKPRVFHFHEPVAALAAPSLARMDALLQSASYDASSDAPADWTDIEAIVFQVHLALLSRLLRPVLIPAMLDEEVVARALRPYDEALGTRAPDSVAERSKTTLMEQRLKALDELVRRRGNDYLSSRTIATAVDLELHAKAVGRRLNRWKGKGERARGDGWKKNPNPGSRGPRSLFRPSAVREELEAQIRLFSKVT